MEAVINDDMRPAGRQPGALRSVARSVVNSSAVAGGGTNYCPKDVKLRALSAPHARRHVRSISSLTNGARVFSFLSLALCYFLSVAAIRAIKATTATTCCASVETIIARTVVMR